MAVELASGGGGADDTEIVEDGMTWSAFLEAFYGGRWAGLDLVAAQEVWLSEEDQQRRKEWTELGLRRMALFKDAASGEVGRRVAEATRKCDMSAKGGGEGRGEGMGEAVERWNWQIGEEDVWQRVSEELGKFGVFSLGAGDFDVDRAVSAVAQVGVGACLQELRERFPTYVPGKKSEEGKLPTDDEVDAQNKLIGAWFVIIMSGRSSQQVTYSIKDHNDARKVVAEIYLDVLQEKTDRIGENLPEVLLNQLDVSWGDVGDWRGAVTAALRRGGLEGDELARLATAITTDLSSYNGKLQLLRMVQNRSELMKEHDEAIAELLKRRPRIGRMPRTVRNSKNQFPAIDVVLCTRRAEIEDLTLRGAAVARMLSRRAFSREDMALVREFRHHHTTYATLLSRPSDNNAANELREAFGQRDFPPCSIEFLANLAELKTEVSSIAVRKALEDTERLGTAGTIEILDRVANSIITNVVTKALTMSSTTGGWPEQDLSLKDTRVSRYLASVLSTSKDQAVVKCLASFPEATSTVRARHEAPRPPRPGVRCRVGVESPPRDMDAGVEADLGAQGLGQGQTDGATDPDRGDAENPLEGEALVVTPTRANAHGFVLGVTKCPWSFLGAWCAALVVCGTWASSVVLVVASWNGNCVKKTNVQSDCTIPSILLTLIAGLAAPSILWRVGKVAMQIDVLKVQRKQDWTGDWSCVWPFPCCRSICNGLGSTFVFPMWAGFVVLMEALCCLRAKCCWISTCRVWHDEVLQQLNFAAKARNAIVLKLNGDQTQRRHRVAQVAPTTNTLPSSQTASTATQQVPSRVLLGQEAGAGALLSSEGRSLSDEGKEDANSEVEEGEQGTSVSPRDVAGEVPDRALVVTEEAEPEAREVAASPLGYPSTPEVEEAYGFHTENTLENIVRSATTDCNFIALRRSAVIQVVAITATNFVIVSECLTLNLPAGYISAILFGIPFFFAAIVAVIFSHRVEARRRLLVGWPRIAKSLAARDAKVLPPVVLAFIEAYGKEDAVLEAAITPGTE